MQILLPILLRQRAPIRDVVGVFGAPREAAPIPRGIVALKEYARQPFRIKVVRHLLEPSLDRAAYGVRSLETPRDMVAV